ncbi:MAG: fibronectin type III domain-containing protein [Chloroflexota bacterium]|nr:fibronectin type III domain-containing protein [Chloroflexota bacterium]
MTAVEVTSDAGEDLTYFLDDEITVQVTFSEAVNVDTTSGAPQLKIDMVPADGGEKLVSYDGGSGTTDLAFTHTVVEPNSSPLGIAVLKNSLQLNDGTITSASSGLSANLAHSGLDHDSDHRVNWRNVLHKCVVSDPTGLSALGIENGAVVFWNVGTDLNGCSFSGYTVEIRREGETSWRAFSIGADDEYTITGLEPGRYEVRVTLTEDTNAMASLFSSLLHRLLWFIPSNNDNAPTVNVDVLSDCAVTLTVSTAGLYEASGSWTNASDAYGCEAGGVYIDWKKTTDSQWKSSHRTPNEDADLNKFIFGSLDAVEYQFRVSTIDARGIGKTDIEDEWMRRSNTATVTPLGKIKNKPVVNTTDIHAIPKGSSGDCAMLEYPTGYCLVVLDKMRAFLEWESVAANDANDYEIRHRTSSDAPYKSKTITAVHTRSVTCSPQPCDESVDYRGYVVNELDKTKQNWIEVGYRATEDGKTKTYWSPPQLASMWTNRFDVGFLDDDTYVAGGRFYTKAYRSVSNASAYCYLTVTGATGSQFNCPPGTLVNLAYNSTKNFTFKGVGSIGPASQRVFDVTGLISYDPGSGLRHERDGFRAKSPKVSNVRVTPQTTPNAKVSWSELTGAGTVSGYKVRHRKVGTSTWTETALLANTTREHTVTGLTADVVYEVQVAAVFTGMGEIASNTEELWTNPAHEFEVWFIDGTPNHNLPTSRIFMMVESNGLSTETSAKCIINGGEINCPPRTLVSLDTVQGGAYDVHATATSTTQGIQDDTSTPVVGVTDAGIIRHIEISGGDDEISVRWLPTSHVRTSHKKLVSQVLRYWSDSEDVYIQKSATDSHHKITGLTSGKKYQVQVYPCANAPAATTVANCKVAKQQRSDANDPNSPLVTVYENDDGAFLGKGSFTREVQLSANTGVPSAPASVSASASGATITVSVKAGASGLARVNGYRVRLTAPNGSVQYWTFTPYVPPHVRTHANVFEINGLNRHTSYGIAVQALNVNGAGKWKEHPNRVSTQ